jgi:hypothetical protein
VDTKDEVDDDDDDDDDERGRLDIEIGKDNKVVVVTHAHTHTAPLWHFFQTIVIKIVRQQRPKISLRASQVLPTILAF